MLPNFQILGCIYVPNYSTSTLSIGTERSLEQKYLHSYGFFFHYLNAATAANPNVSSPVFSS